MSDTTISITLYGEELLLDIRNKSDQELAGVADTQQRYSSVAGRDKDEDVKRSLQEAYHYLRSLCHEFLTVTNDNSVDDRPQGITEDSTLTLALTLAGRRDGSQLQEGIANAMHAYLVEKTLELYYGSSPARDLSVLHAARAAVNGDEVQRLLYRRRKPNYTQYT